jgi:hypothetical protein
MHYSPSHLGVEQSEAMVKDLLPSCSWRLHMAADAGVLRLSHDER